MWVEFAVEVVHAGGAVDPAAQVGVGTLTLEPLDTLIDRQLVSKGAAGSFERGDRLSGGISDQCFGDLTEPLLGLFVESGGQVGDGVDVGAGHRAVC
ncbi:MAG: hypothetical protein ACR2LO_06365 [Ilumatobacteraceae bacterium]